MEPGRAPVHFPGRMGYFQKNVDRSGFCFTSIYIDSICRTNTDTLFSLSKNTGPHHHNCRNSMYGNSDADAFYHRNAITEHKNSRINPTLSDPGFFYSEAALEKENA